MISPERAMSNHVAAGRKRAAVCSIPPSCVGVGMTVSCFIVIDVAPMLSAEPEEDGEARGKRYKYI